MKLFLDSADLEEIRRYAPWHVIDGITTTPTFFRRLGIEDSAAALAAIAAEFSGEIHVEALGEGVEEIIDAARRNHEIAPRVVSKLPISAASLEATSRLREEGIRVNLHLVFSVNQAFLAAQAGAAYVCPLVGRMSDAGLNPDEVVGDIVRAMALGAFDTEVMVSSVRSPEVARRAILSGASSITVPGRVLGQMIESPLTDRAFAILARDSVGMSPVSTRMRSPEELPQLDLEDRLSDALTAMTLKGIGIAAVIRDGELRGVVTDGDLRRSLTRDLSTLTRAVQTIMTRDPAWVRPGDRVEEALALMASRRITQVLVLGDDRKVVGFLNLHNLMADERPQ